MNSDLDTLDAAERARIEFLDNEIDLCQTFLDVAKIDADDPSAAACAKAKADVGYQTALGFVSTIRSAQQRGRIMGKLYQLRARLDEVGK